jgi:hypothetical protein
VEAAALTPSPWLDRIVTLLIPPGAREAVLGDLHECCVTSRQFAKEALAVAPFVIFSQAQRNLNLPALLIKAGLLFWCLGGGVVLAFLPLLMLWDAYQPVTRPSPRDALRGAVLVSFSGAMLLLLVSVVLGQGLELATAHRGSALLALFILGMPLSALLCAFRTCLIIGSDRLNDLLRTELSAEDLADRRQAYLCRARFCNLVEGIVMALAAICWAFSARGGPPSSMALAATYGIAGVFLLMEFAPQDQPASDFVSIRARYRHELARQQQLRCFLWWLWFAPALLALQTRAVAGQLTVMQSSIAAMLLCFLITALNREGVGRMRERVGALELARERHG